MSSEAYYLVGEGGSQQETLQINRKANEISLTRESSKPLLRIDLMSNSWAIAFWCFVRQSCTRGWALWNSLPHFLWVQVLGRSDSHLT